MRYSLAGFTLIQILIVLSIIGTLSATAIPAYDSYVKKSRITEAINFSSAAKSNIAEFMMLNKRYPVSATEAGITLGHSQLIDQMILDDQGTLSVMLNEQKMGAPITVAMKANFDASGNVTWQCGIAGNISYQISTCNDKTVEVYEQFDNSQFDELNSQLATLNVELQTLSSQAHSLNNQLQELKESEQILKNQSNTLKAEKKSIRDESTALRKTLTELNKAKRQASSAEQKAIQNEITQVIEKMSAANNALRENTLALDNTNQAINANQSAQSTVSNAINTSNEQIQSIQNKIESTSDKISSLNQDVKMQN